jgi:hypothetical protein
LGEKEVRSHEGLLYLFACGQKFHLERGKSNLLADMGIASPPVVARNVTVEVVTFVLEFPEV